MKINNHSRLALLSASISAALLISACQPANEGAAKKTLRLLQKKQSSLTRQPTQRPARTPIMIWQR